VARHSPNSSARAADRVDAAQRNMLRWHRRVYPRAPRRVRVIALAHRGVQQRAREEQLATNSAGLLIELLSFGLNETWWCRMCGRLGPVR